MDELPVETLVYTWRTSLNMIARSRRTSPWPEDDVALRFPHLTTQIKIPDSLVLMGRYEPSHVYGKWEHAYRLRVGKTTFRTNGPYWTMFSHWHAPRFIEAGGPIRFSPLPLDLSPVLDVRDITHETEPLFECFIPMTFRAGNMGEGILPLIEGEHRSPLHLITEGIYEHFKIGPKAFLAELLPVLIQRYASPEQQALS